VTPNGPKTKRADARLRREAFYLRIPRESLRAIRARIQSSPSVPTSSSPEKPTFPDPKRPRSSD